VRGKECVEERRVCVGHREMDEHVAEQEPLELWPAVCTELLGRVSKEGGQGGVVNYLAHVVGVLR
jgi:hypothetical protein